MRGWSRNSQPIATAKPGISKPMVMNVSKTVFPGKSVRSTNQAAGRPNKNETASAMSEKPAVFQQDFVSKRLGENRRCSCSRNSE